MFAKPTSTFWCVHGRFFLRDIENRCVHGQTSKKWTKVDVFAVFGDKNPLVSWTSPDRANFALGARTRWAFSFFPPSSGGAVSRTETSGKQPARALVSKTKKAYFPGINVRRIIFCVRDRTYPQPALSANTPFERSVSWLSGTPGQEQSVPTSFKDLDVEL